MLALDAALSPLLEVIRFNFPYVEKKSRRPDPMPVLVQSIRENAAAHPRCFLGGRSMGGRAASMLAAEGFDCAGLLLFAYPLHPAGQQEKPRTAHLERIRAPVLCFNGTRDPLCNPALMRKSTENLENWTQHWLEGADHSFHVLKSSGRTDAEVMDEVTRVTAAWLQDCTDVQ